MPRKTTALVFAIASVALVIAGCGSQSSTAKGSSKPTVASASHKNEVYYWVSQDTSLPLFVQNDYVGMRAFAKQYGVTVKVAGPSGLDLPQLISTIEEVCAQHPAGVDVVGWDPSETAAVNQCVAEGVPTVTDDADLPGSKELAFVGTNWYDIGVAQAQAMIKALHGKGQVAVLGIFPESNDQQALQGFEATVKGTGVKVVTYQNDSGDPSHASSDVASLLAAYPNLAGIAGFDALSGIGVIPALQSAGKLGKIKVTAMEDTASFFKTVQSGQVAAIVVQKRELFTYYALRLLYDFHHDGLTVDGLSGFQSPPIPININTGLLTVTKTNVGPILKALHIN